MKAASNRQRNTVMFALCCLFLLYTTHALQSTLILPLIDVPTYSLATLDEQGKTNMNIIMYVTPGSITPDRLWCVGVIKSSLTHINFISSKFGILQLLRPQQSSLVKLLGSSSGRDVDKQWECGKLGFEWQPLEDEIGADGDLPLTLPGCAHYLLLRCIEVVDGGSHDVFIFKVEKMWTIYGETRQDDNEDSYLSTRKLRQLGIITNQGHVTEA
jgi:flavin reductase (DIM6/NTAB) family NADH-FMN oxidoreductase RutF